MTFPYILLAIAVTGVWGFSFVVMRDLIEYLPPLLAASTRVVAASLPILVLVRPPRIAWYWMLSIGLTQGVIQQSLLFFGMHFGVPAGLASLLIQVQVLFTTAFAYLILREQPRWAQYVGIAVSGAGMLLIAFTLPGGGSLIGFTFIVVAAASWAVSNMVVKLAGTDDLLRLVAWAHAIGILPMFVIAVAVEGWPTVTSDLLGLTWYNIGEITMIGLVSNCFGFMAWSYLMRRHSASVVAPFSLLIPVFGMTAAALLLGEAFGPWRVVGAALVLVGLAFGTVRLRAAAA